MKLSLTLCLDCYNYFNNGPTYEWEYEDGPEVNSETFNYYHNYHPDNLTYIEKLAERRGLV